MNSMDIFDWKKTKVLFTKQQYLIQEIINKKIYWNLKKTVKREKKQWKVINWDETNLIKISIKLIKKNKKKTTQRLENVVQYFYNGFSPLHSVVPTSFQRLFYLTLSQLCFNVASTLVKDMSKAIRLVIRMDLEIDW